MDPKVKAAWVDALRNGKYKQGVERLRREDHFCCLGVLAEVCDLDSERGSDGVYRYHFPLRGVECYEDAAPPEGFCGLSRTWIDELISKNDNGKTFLEIADYIEKEIG